MPTQNSADKQITDSIYIIRELVAPDLAAMHELIKQQLHSNIPLIETIAKHIIDSGGKQIRPLLTLLAAKIFNYQGEGHYQLSTVLEFIHTATLLHDDVIDASHLRRGKTAAHEIWGNQASVLVGDFLYSRAFQILTQYHHTDEVLNVLANATNSIVEGEMDQLVNKHNPNLTEDNYLKIVRSKTASLFAAATEIGAVLAKANPIQRQALAHYGSTLGIAFQIIDDLLDYTASTAEIGKNIGDDLAEGKVTLPLIYTLHYCQPQQREQIQLMIKNGANFELELIIETMQSTPAVEKTYQRAQEFANQAEQALQSLPNNQYRKALAQLITFAVNRRF